MYSEQDPEQLLAALALSSAELSPKAWNRLLEQFGDHAGILAASDSDLAALRNISEQVRARVVSARGKVQDMNSALERLEKLGVSVAFRDEPGYPTLLRQIADPPPLLYVRGKLQEDDRFGVAIVGSRNPRPYGLTMARRLATDLSRAGLTIVSGGARGVDGAAHEAVLRAQGRTIAVLGCGIDICYPSEHKELFERIAAAGAVISEFPVGAAPETWRFPRRNRIISGVSRGVIVCDAAEDSGALITATCAAEQNRDVFAVPGNVDSDHNRGTHKLLKEGAKLVEGAEDVLAEYGLDARTGGDGRAAELPPVEVSAEERKILEMLDLEPMPLDTVIENANMPASEVAALLTFLEMKRLVKRVAGPAYVRVLR